MARKKEKLIDGIPFILYKKCKSEIEAKEEKKKYQEKGYYTRILNKNDLWVSTNPRWFYNLGAF